MKSLNSKHRMVARYMAMGATLKDVCDAYKLSYSTWSNITCTPLFRAEIDRLQKDLDERMLEEIAEDPVFQQLKISALKAARTLDAEVDNFDKEGGASPGTRVMAARTILDASGYGKAKDNVKTPSITVVIGDTLSRVMKSANIEPMPEMICG